MLTDGLHATRRAGRPKQFFLRKAEPEYAAAHNLDLNRGFAAYVHDIVRITATSNEVFGFKLMSWYLDDFLSRLRATGEFGGAETDDVDLMRNAFPRLQFVHVSRRHKLRQALSKARAEQTGLWKVQEGKRIQQEPAFDARLIEQCLRDGEVQERQWEEFFARNRIEPFRVQYETMTDDYEATIRAVLAFLEISLPRSYRIGPPVTVRQSDELSREWEERFLAEHRGASLVHV